MASLTLKGIYKVYNGEVKAVNDLNLYIRDKEFVVLVGPSGCGKSTTLRMIAGLEDITQGELYIGDRLVNDVAPKDRDIAMVFQNYALYPHMTVYENMAFGLKLRKIPKTEIDRRVKEASKILDIEHLLARKPKALSGGQSQRVALGRAIVREPKVFLMDEPLSNLDAKLRVQMRTEIIKLHNRLQTTFVYVTHDQTEAMTMGSRIVVMKDGVMQQVDTPQNLYDYPDNQFVAGFMGSPQMNFIPCMITDVDGKIYADFTRGRILLNDYKKSKFKDLTKYIGRQVIMGIRPEDIHNDEDHIAKANENLVKAYVDVVENLGAYTYFYMNIEGMAITAMSDSRTQVRCDDTITVAFDVNRLHFFDYDTEETILNR